MTAAVKITLAYLFVSATWFLGVEELLVAVFPSTAAGLKGCICWPFLILASGVIYFLLLRETVRRDAVETNLRALAIHDSLTGLSNRACFMAHLEKSISRAARESGKVGIAFIDLDGFKAVNDRFGHQVGDQLLVEISRRVNRVVRSSDVVARLGGDEFVILAQDEQAAGLRRLAERLSRALQEPFVLMDEAIAVTASVGLAVYPDHGQQAEQLLHAADLAMYQVKAAGKNGIRRARCRRSPLRSAAAA